jgi:glutamine amidotransferase-like uncharacterized protein
LSGGDPLADLQSKDDDINVLIFNGDGAIENSVASMEDELDEVNSETSSYHYNYSTTDIINSEILSSCDVLIMPGGDASTYIETDDIDNAAIKKFVAEGKGYVGICAGAYVASKQVDGHYSGWGIAPNVNTKIVSYTGQIPISITSYGSKVLKESSTQYMHMENGPAMYTNVSQMVMAEYTNNKTGYQNYAAIVGDTYGSGRVLLSSPHPELSPQNSQLLAVMISWAAKRI